MAEQPYGPTDGASVVLDIGGDIGAVIVHAPESLAGAEIEIGPKDAKATRTRPKHTAVRLRRTTAGARFAAVFPAVRAGEYTLRSLSPRTLTTQTVTVMGGQVIETDW